MHYTPDVPFVLNATKCDLRGNEAIENELKAQGLGGTIPMQEVERFGKECGAHKVGIHLVFC